MMDDDLRAADIGDEAVEYSNEVERDAFVQRACGGDSALIAKVRAYIAGGNTEPPFLAAPFSSVNNPIDPENGRLIGHWKLVRRLGEGGFGLVYLVERKDGQVRQRGAMKFLKGTMHSRDLELRFRDERQILADLNHKYIVGLIDAGLTDDRQPYLVMDMVDDAQPIDDFCRNKSLTISERVELFRNVCEAVQYAHEMKVIHRDLKPANILVNGSGPHLVDFGVAKILDPIHRADQIAARSTNILIGTGRYFSPEQARCEPVDGRSDVYSLGVILYELLAGTDPYRLKETHHQRSIGDIICTVTPEPPSEATRRSLADAKKISAFEREPKLADARRGLTNDLDAIVLMALRKDRNRRYQTVTELSDDLGRYLNSLTVLAGSEPIWYGIPTLIRKTGLRVTVAVLGLIIAAVLIAYRFGLLFGDKTFSTEDSRQYHYTIAGPNGPISPYTVDDYLEIKLNGKPLGYGKFTGCGPPGSPSRCPESAAINFMALPGSQLEVVASDLGGGYLLTELELYKDNRPVLQLNDPILNDPSRPCAPIPCSWTVFRKNPVIFFGRTYTLP